MKNQKGFNLIEMLIVIAIIGIIAAIAIPNLLAANRAANERLAISSLQQIHDAQIAYKAKHNEYAKSLSELEVINPSLERSGYVFTTESVQLGPSFAGRFFASAIPTVPTGVLQTGARRLGITTEGVVYYDLNLKSHFADEVSVKAATQHK